MQRLHTHEIEIGTSEVLQRHITRHVAAAQPVSQRRLDFEHRRPRWLREMAAEATGVFFYGVFSARKESIRQWITDRIAVYPGIAATAAFTTEHANPAFGSILTIGLAYGMGIALAIICCASTSGGTFSLPVCLARISCKGPTNYCGPNSSKAELSQADSIFNRRTLQPSSYCCIRCMARLSLKKGAHVYFRSNLRCFHGRIDPHGTISRTDWRA
jgi:hypothetical protein